MEVDSYSTAMREKPPDFSWAQATVADLELAVWTLTWSNEESQQQTDTTCYQHPRVGAPCMAPLG